MAFGALILLGVVQGISEFLPISSSGHLVLLSHIFGVKDSLLTSIILHVATLFAILIVFRKDVVKMLKNPLSHQSICLALSTICTCAIAICIMPFLKNSFEGKILPITFALSGLFLYAVEKFAKNKTSEPISFKHSIVIGLFQGFALLPGLSRSGTTISAGILSGADKKECAKFSFLLSIPTILASMLLEIIDISKEGVGIDVNVWGMIFACVVAFTIAFFSIKFMISLTEKTNFKWFAFYLWIISAVSMFIFW